MKRLFSVLLSLALLLALCPMTLATADDPMTAADHLHELGLFQGTGTDAAGNPTYELGRAPTRAEALVMLIRLLGEEAEAKTCTAEHPFTDVKGHWAEPYVAYAYSKGYTNGMTPTTFAPTTTAQARMYLTFVLRALGYVSGKDFAYETVWEKTDALGITGGEYNAATNDSFLRGDVAMISDSALEAAYKGGGETLLEKLRSIGAVTEPTKASYHIVVWASEAAKELTERQIADFNATNPYGLTFNATVLPVSESLASNTAAEDPAACADLFCFAQDQLGAFLNLGLLDPLGSQQAAAARSANSQGTVKACEQNGRLWAYPLTSDNGYFMYYDKSVIPEADVDSLEALIADCEAAGKYFAFEAQTSAWYIASWFFGTGCVSEWTTETAEDGKVEFVSVNDTFDSANGLIAVRGMKKLLDSPMHLSSSSAEEFANGAAVVVTGTWAYNSVQDILGDKMGTADLPSFEVDGNSYHLGSFNGCKLLGVKPQADAAKQAALHRLAQFLTDHDRQMERFHELAWGPANLEAQQSPEVQVNPGLAALFAQNAYSVPQGIIHGFWWDIGKVIADDVKAAKDEADLQKALDNYRDKIASLFT